MTLQSIDNRTLGRYPSKQALENSRKGFVDSYAGIGFAGTFGVGGVGRNQDIAPTKYGAASAYRLVPPINRAVNLRADAHESLPWKIIRNKTNDPANDVVIARSTDNHPAHPFARALMRLRRRQKASLFWLMEYADLVYGEIFVEYMFNDVKVAGLNWLNPLAVYIETRNGVITRFLYSDLNGEAYIPLAPDEVAYDRTLNPFDDWRGLSRVNVAVDKVNVYRNTNRFIEAFFRNNAQPGGTVSPPDSETHWTDNERDIIKNEFRRNMQGSDNSFSWLVAPRPLKIDSFTPPNIKEQYDINDPVMREIYTVFGVPLAMAGDTNGTDYQNQDATLTWFYQNTVIPAAKKRQFFVNTDLLPYFDPEGDCRFEFDTTAFDLVSADDEIRSRVSKDNYVSGLWTLNESRTYTKKPPLPDGDTVLQPTSARPNVFNDTTNPQAGEPNGTTQQTQAANQIVQSKNPELPAKAATQNSSAYVYLPLSNNAQLVAIQNQLKPLLGDGINYQDPQTFHVTLLYCNDIPDHDLNEIVERGIAFDNIPITGSKLGLFENGDERALHIEVDLHPALTKLQKTIHAHFLDHGYEKEVSAFSQPDSYKPHITLAYLPKNIEMPHMAISLAESVNSFVYARDDYKTFAVTTSTKALPAIIEGKATQATADDELRAWQKKATKNWKAPFEPIKLRGDLGDFIAAGITASNGDENALKTVFSQARERLAVKAIAATQLEFEMEFGDLLARVQNDKTDRRTFSASLRYFLNKFGKQAYLDGLQDGGVQTDELDDEDRGKIAEMLAEQSQYVSELGSVLFKGDGITDIEAANKPTMWWNKSVLPMYQAGLVSADRNGLYEWVYGDAEHCDTCLKLNGQRHRLRDYQRKGLLPKSGDLDCGGYNCKCQIVKVVGKARGNWV